MSNNFINKFYDNRSKNIAQLGFLGYLHDKLTKYEITRKDVALKLSPKNVSAVLDIGCDEGELLRRFKEDNPKTNIFGIDVCKKSVETCKEKFKDFKKNFSFQNIDDGLTFENEKFDLIFMIATLEHVFDPIFAIKEVARIIKPGGVFILEVPNIVFLPYRLKFLFGIRPRTSWGYGWDGGHIGYFTRKDLQKALKEENFIIEKTTGSGIFLNFRNWWGSLLLPNIIIKARKEI